MSKRQLKNFSSRLAYGSHIRVNARHNDRALISHPITARRVGISALILEIKGRWIAAVASTLPRPCKPGPGCMIHVIDVPSGINPRTRTRRWPKRTVVRIVRASRSVENYRRLKPAQPRPATTGIEILKRSHQRRAVYVIARVVVIGARIPCRGAA